MAKPLDPLATTPPRWYKPALAVSIVMFFVVCGVITSLFAWGALWVVNLVQP